MIVSIYLKGHEYITENPQTFNFGGKYIYSFEEKGCDLYVTKKLNEKYIPDFFNISGSKCNVNLLSAIVGANGIGKSSVLDIIRNIFASGFPHSTCVVLVEENGETKVLYSNIGLNIYLEGQEIEKVDKENYQSIYYSPHFDLKYNPNFDKVDDYDISLDEYIKQDLENIDKRGTNESGWKYPKHEELKYKNTLRIVEFMNSKPFHKGQILDVFSTNAKYEDVELIFREIEFNNDFWNTPSQFRDVIEKIWNILEEEIKEWISIRKFDNEQRVQNQDEINKYLLKRFIIQAILSVICRMLEEDAGNFYLEEGEIDNEEIFKKDTHNSEELFLLFLRHTYVNRDGRKKIFEDSLYQELLMEIEKVVKPITEENDITKQKVKVRIDDIVKIIDIHRKCVKNLMNYFDDNTDKSLNLYEFIGINPYKTMSSGEYALLNLFSRLYYFIDNRDYLLNKQNYILLLDEADLGFHPIWKKKYVKAILETLPYFFENLKVKPNLQIIITTHDPLTLSDLPINNVIFLQKQGNYCQVVAENHKIQKTFGANIADLLAHSFFIENGLIGDFAKSKIEETITWINEQKNVSVAEIDKAKLEYYKKVISLIDERVMRLKLTEMITALVPDDDYHNQMIDDEIEKLKKLKK